MGVRSLSVGSVIASLALGLSGLITTAMPAQAAACSPASTANWIGDGTNGSTVGANYKLVTFSTAGTCDWNVPSVVTTITALAVGAGGGGGAGSGTFDGGYTPSGTGAVGGGGGGGAVVVGSGSVTPGATLSIVVGAGGTKGTPGNAGDPGGCGANGGDSSISALSLTASGGKGGVGGGLNADCSTENRAAGTNYFLPGIGGNSGSGLTGGAAGSHAGGQGASVTSNGGTSMSVVAGQTLTFGNISGTYSNGGGGGSNVSPYYGSPNPQSGIAGSGGGGGREPLYMNLYRYGYNGTNGAAGLVIIRYEVETVTATSPGAITLGDDVPTVGYTGSPSISLSDWSTPPTCGVYAAGDLSSPLTNITEAGTYVTHCEGGVLSGGGDVMYADGTLTVNPLVIKASSPDPMQMGGSAPAITFTVEPAGATPDWETEPTCGVYAAGNLSTPLRTISQPGSYVTHCVGGELSNGATAFIFEDGTFIVEAALPNTGLMWMTLVGVGMLSAVFYLLGGGVFGARNKLRVAGIDLRVTQKMAKIRGSLERMETMSKRRQQRDRLRSRRD